MSKEVRDFIDLAGKELKYRLELEKTVEQLQNEIISLKKQTTEQKSLIKENDNSSKSKNLDTEDIQILKDMVMTQKEELGKKESKIEALDSKIDELYSELENAGNIIDELKDTSVLENAHDVIDDLMEEKSKFEYQIAGLNKKIADLEEENEKLLQNIDTVKIDQETFDNLNIKIAEFSDKISNLEKINEIHSENVEKIRNERDATVAKLRDKIGGLYEIISYLEEKNKALLEIGQTPTIDQSTITNYENNIIRLQKKVAELENENKIQVEKNQMLKAALLLHVDVESKHVAPEANVMEDERIISIPKGIVQNRIKVRDQAVKSREESGQISPEEIGIENEEIGIESEEIGIESEEIEEPTIEPEISTPSYYETSKISEASEISEVSENLEPAGTEKLSETSVPTSNQEQEEVIIESSTGRRKCPKCGTTNKMLIREMPDKTRMISFMAGLYGKKYKCGQCGAEWR